MPRPGSTPEKSKDFTGSVKRLFKCLEKWKFLVIISLMIAFLSAIISLIAPNRLSELTDTITEGIKLQISEEKIQEIMSSPNISDDDKKTFADIIKDAQSSITENNEENQNLLISKMDLLPESIKKRNRT